MSLFIANEPLPACFGLISPRLRHDSILTSQVKGHEGLEVHPRRRCGEDPLSICGGLVDGADLTQEGSGETAAARLCTASWRTLTEANIG